MFLFCFKIFWFDIRYLNMDMNIYTFYYMKLKKKTIESGKLL